MNRQSEGQPQAGVGGNSVGSSPHRVTYEHVILGRFPSPMASGLSSVKQVAVMSPVL